MEHWLEKSGYSNRTTGIFPSRYEYKHPLR